MHSDVLYCPYTDLCRAGGGGGVEGGVRLLLPSSAVLPAQRVNAGVVEDVAAVLPVAALPTGSSNCLPSGLLKTFKVFLNTDNNKNVKKQIHFFGKNLLKSNSTGGFLSQGERLEL